MSVDNNSPSAIGEGPIYYFLEEAELLSEKDAGELQAIATKSRQMYFSGMN